MRNEVRKSIDLNAIVNIPVIIPVSGRTSEGTSYLLDQVKDRYSDGKFRALLHKIYSKNIANNEYRGYQIFGESSLREV